MAQSLAPTGTSARVIAFPNSAPQPVQQQRRAGRHPKMVAQLWKARNREVAPLPPQTSAIEELRSAITNGLNYVADCQYRLALLTQTNKGASHV